jgi:hypothetical protein
MKLRRQSAREGNSSESLLGCATACFFSVPPAAITSNSATPKMPIASSAMFNPSNSVKTPKVKRSVP